MRLRVKNEELDLEFDGSSAEFQQGIKGLMRLTHPDSFDANEPVQSAYLDAISSSYPQGVARPLLPAEYLLPPSHHASAIVASQPSPPAPNPEIEELRSLILTLLQAQQASSAITAECRTVETPALPPASRKRTWTLVSTPLLVALTIAAVLLGGGLAYRSKNPSVKVDLVSPSPPGNQKKSQNGQKLLPLPSLPPPLPGNQKNQQRLPPPPPPASTGQKVVCIPLPVTQPPECK